MKLRMGNSKIPISLLFSELGKNQKYNELGKNMFYIQKKKEFYFKLIGNSAHTTEFLPLRKFDVLPKQMMKALQVQLSTSTTMISW